MRRLATYPTHTNHFFTNNANVRFSFQMRALALCTLMAILLLTTPPAFAEKVNINKADASALMTLKGIGEKRANAIIKYRKKNGNFSSAKDLLDVPGMGPEILKGIQRNLSISGGLATAPKAAASKTKKKAATAKDTKKKSTDKKKAKATKSKSADKKKKSTAKSKDKKKGSKSKDKKKPAKKTKDKKKKKKKKKSST